jgi:hypothetical protein
MAARTGESLTGLRSPDDRVLIKLPTIVIEPTPPPVEFFLCWLLVAHYWFVWLTLRITRAPGGAALAAVRKRRDDGLRRVDALVRRHGFD